MGGEGGGKDNFQGKKSTEKFSLDGAVRGQPFLLQSGLPAG